MKYRACLPLILSVCLASTAAFAAGAPEPPARDAVGQKTAGGNDEAVEIVNEPPKQIQWVKAIGDIDKRAVAENKPIFVFFYTTWCPQSKVAVQDLLPDPSVVLLMDEFVPAALDAERIPVVAKKYDVKNYPTLIVTDSKGKELARQVGMPYPMNRFPKLLATQLVQTSIPRLEEQARAKPDDTRTLAKMVMVYAAQGNLAKAKQVYDWLRKSDAKDLEPYLFPMDRAMAEGLRDVNAFNVAIPFFKSVMAQSRDPYEVAQAQYALACGYLSTGEWGLAVPQLTAVAGNTAGTVSPGQREWAAKYLAAGRPKGPIIFR